MLIRTTKVQVQSGKIDEFVRQWRELIAPRMPEMSGLRRVYLCGNRDTNTVMTLHLWDTPPDQAARGIHDKLRFREQVRDLLAGGDPETEEYEIVAMEERP